MKKSFDIEFIKSHLERGEIRKLAKESELSYAYACDCLHEKKSAFNFEFMIRCHNKAVERANILVAMKEQTQSLKTVLQ